jgi:hypothetical protein
LLKGIDDLLRTFHDNKSISEKLQMQRFSVEEPTLSFFSTLSDLLEKRHSVRKCTQNDFDAVFSMVSWEWEVGSGRRVIGPMKQKTVSGRQWEVGVGVEGWGLVGGEPRDQGKGILHPLHIGGKWG